MSKISLQSLLGKMILGILFMFLSYFKSYATDYYVNDNDNSGDIFCVSTGAAYNVISNDGLSNDQPLLSLTAVLAAHGPSGTNMITSGDVFYIDAGMYYQTDANLGINLDNISIIGAGSQLTVFDNDAASADANLWAIITGNGILIQGVFLTGYNNGTGDAIALQINGATNFTINDVMVNENLPGGGSAAIFITGGSTGTFNGGGSSCNPPNPSVAGGGVNIQGNNNVVTFNNYTLAGNSKDLQGGAAMRINGNATTIVTINNSLIEDNYTTAGEGGGGILAFDGCQVTITGSCFNNNRATTASSVNYGGAIMVGEGSDLIISNCSFDGNYASPSGNGGAIAINSTTGSTGGMPTVSLNTCSFSNNSAEDGNDLFTRGAFGGEITANECTWSTTASEELHIDAGSITLTFSGSPDEIGGATDDGNPATLSPSTVCPASGVICYSVILPVEFLDFNIACEGENTQFNWSTASERNNDYFIINYSNDFINWSQILREKGKGTTQLRSDYKVELENAQSGYYKLSQVDTDGKLNELKTAFIKNCAKGFTIYPNPTNDEVNISLVGFEKNATIQVYNAVGVLVYENELLIENEFYSGKIDLREFANGAYIIRAFDERNNSQQKVVKH